MDEADRGSLTSSSTQIVLDVFYRSPEEAVVLPFRGQTIGDPAGRRVVYRSLANFQSSHPKDGWPWIPRSPFWAVHLKPQVPQVRKGDNVDEAVFGKDDSLNERDAPCKTKWTNG